MQIAIIAVIAITAWFPARFIARSVTRLIGA